MNLLAFDTSTDTLSIAVQRGRGAQAQIWQHTGAGGAQASAALIPAIQQLMGQAGLQFDQLQAIAFGAGPGSFTGLRTACSVAQGLAFGANVPVLPVDTLLAVAEEARWSLSAKAPADGPCSEPTEPTRVLAVLDARMNEVYAACYEINSELFNKHGGYRLISPEKLLEDLPEGWFAPLRSGSAPWVMAGNAFAVYGDRLTPSINPSARAVQHIHALPTATALLRLAPALLAAGHAVQADQALPTYIRDKVAKTTQERLAEKAAA